MTPNFLPWLVLLLPLAAAGLILVFTRKNPRLSAGLSIEAVVAGFILSVVFVRVAGWAPQVLESSVPWLNVADLQVEFGLRLDTLSLLMMLVVSGVASLNHI
jgi:NADH-quinone oxidoreductase subunit L